MEKDISKFINFLKTGQVQIRIAGDITLSPGNISKEMTDSELFTELVGCCERILNNRHF